MKRKFLTTVMVSMSLLSINLFAGSNIKCTGTHCMVDLSTLSKTIKKREIKQNNFRPILIEGNDQEIIIDGLVTIIPSSDKFVVTEEESVDYHLQNVQEYLISSFLKQESYQSEEKCNEQKELVYNQTFEILECT